MERDLLLGIASHEREALGRTIQYTPPERWEAESPCQGWTNRDVVAHLAASETAAAAVLAGEVPEEVQEYLRSTDGGPATVDGFNAWAVERRREASLRQVTLEWGQAADRMLTHAAGIGPDEWPSLKVPWVVGEMPARFVLQSRVMEWWLHGHDIRMGAGLSPRLEHWPIFATNDLAIRSLPWALSLAGIRYHGKSIRVELDGPGAGSWHYGLAPREVPAKDRAPDAWITGRGYPFALVAGHRAQAEEYVENGTLLIGGDEDLALTVLTNIRAFS